MEQTNTPSPEDYAKLIELYRADVSIFAQQVFGFTLSAKQREIADAVQNNRLVTVRGAISIGKTAVMAIIAWQNLVCYPEVLVTLWGPNEGNLRDGVVRAMREFHDKMAEPFKSQFECGAERFYRKLNSASCYAQMRLASKERPDAARGLHQIRNVVLADECTEIDDSVLEILMNILSDKDPKILLISNPSRRSGFYWKTHCDEEVSQHWVKIHATIKDAPNYDEERTAALIAQYGGPTSNKHRSMILGEWPLSDETGLIPREHIDLAVDNENAIAPVNSPYVWGVDVAGKGADSSVLVIRQDNVVHEIIEWSGFDTVQSAHKVADLYKRTPKNKRPAIISVDSNGLGYGFASDLKHMGLPVFECNTSKSPTRNPDRYFRLRDQVWVELAEWFATENVRIPNNAKLIEELCEPNYDDSRGKIKVEGKPELKKRLGRSPDVADALSLTFGPSKLRYSGVHSWSKPIQYDHLQSLQ